MYIGNLINNADVSYYKRGTNIALAPDGGDMIWKWTTVMDTGVDIVYSLKEKSFIGSVSIKLGEKSGIKAAEVYCDDVISGRYDAETGKTVSGSFDIPVGAAAKEVKVRLYAYLLDINIEDIVICGAVDNGPLVYPTPDKASFSDETICLCSIGAVEGDMNNADVAFAANHLKERIGEYYGENLFNGSVPVKMELCSCFGPDDYKLSVKKDGILIKAAGRRGLLYGCETLFQLISDKKIPVCEIDDKPYREMRGFHFYLPPKDKLDFAKKIFKYVLLPLKYNMLFVEFCGGMRFDRHPEISEGWVRGNKLAKEGKLPQFPHGQVADGGLLEKSEVSDLIEYGRSLGFEIVPEVQSFGHVQYITFSHPEIAEKAEEEAVNDIKDTRDEDQPPDVTYYHTYCPQNEKSYEIIYDIIDEIVEVAKPERYVHMGHDEIYQIGLCPKCKDKNHAELYAKHVNAMYDYLAKKGYKMAIWCDMLQPTEKRYQTSPAIDMIPKDILMLDFIWYFHFDLDMEDHILPHGFKMISGNLYSSHFPRFESRMAKDGMLGGEVSTWCTMNEYMLAKKGKIFDLMYTSEMLWSDTYTSKARSIYNRIIADKIIKVRDEIRGIIIKDGYKAEYTPIALESNCSCIPTVIKNAADAYVGSDFDTSNTIIVDNETVKVGDKYDRIVFLHTTLNNERRVAWQPLDIIGSYIVKYSDGTSENIPVEYAGNICVWSQRYAEPLPQQYYRHQGYIATYFSDPIIETKSECGEHITVLGFNWVNPYPEKEITAIECISANNTDAKIALLAVSGVNIK